MATGIKLTQSAIEDAVCPPGKKDILLFDRETKGFGLRVSKNGTKTFLAQYQSPGGKRRVVLGTFGVLTPDQARRAAKGILGQAALGADPVAEKREKQAKTKQASEEAAFTFGRLVEEWAESREGDRRPSYLKIAKGSLTVNLPDWQTRPAASITLAQAVRVLDGLKATKGPIAANRTLSYARAAYSWAVRRQRLAINPLSGIERPGRETPRERVLTGADLGAISRACDELSPTLAAFVRVLLLTLQRRDEVASMQWAELDSVDAPTTWTLPRERAKNGRAHIVHLSEPVRAILRAMPRIQANPYVFAAGRPRRPTDGSKDPVAKPISAFALAKNEIAAALVKAGYDLSDWRFHDFRRAGVTALADMGFAPHVCDRLLNHVTGAIQGVAAVYQRAEFLGERKVALDAWATLVAAAAEGKQLAGNVVQMSRTGSHG